MSEHASPDQELLHKVLEEAELNDSQRVIFEDMLHKTQRYGRPLSQKQRDFARAALAGEKYDPEPEYENLVSSGRVPIGRPVPTPPVLLQKPLKPPPRPHDTRVLGLKGHCDDCGAKPGEACRR